MPTAMPAMMFVAGPVFDPFAIDMTEQALALSLPEIEEVTLEPVLLRQEGLDRGEFGCVQRALLQPELAQ